MHSRSTYQLLYLHMLTHTHVQLVHRDIKPTNILLSRDHKSLRLADFGLCKVVSWDHDDDLEISCGSSHEPSTPISRESIPRSPANSLRAAIIQSFKDATAPTTPSGTNNAKENWTNFTSPASNDSIIRSPLKALASIRRRAKSRRLKKLGSIVVPKLRCTMTG
jgi:serine/threonine protein kinase